MSDSERLEIVRLRLEQLRCRQDVQDAQDWDAAILDLIHDEQLFPLPVEA